MYFQPIITKQIKAKLKNYPLKSGALKNYLLKSAVLPTSVIYVNPSLKNSCQIDPSFNGSYQFFICKYSNYTANKKHTTHNFKYLCNLYKLDISGLRKLDDIADAVIQCWAYCKKNKLI